MSALDDKFYRPTITHRVDVGPSLWTVRIKPDGDFNYNPGQYATLGVQRENRRSERPYSIVSAPFESEIEFFLELVPGGDLTPQLHRLQPGDTLLMRKAAKGRFTLDMQTNRTNHLLLCTVTGVAPFVSYVRNLYRRWKEGNFSGDHKLFLLNGASSSREFGYCSELQKFAMEVDWLQYVPTVSRPWEDKGWRGETGRVDDILRKYADIWSLSASNTISYMCGHPEMIERSKGILKRIGLEKEWMREEFYWVPGRDAAAS